MEQQKNHSVFHTVTASNNSPVLQKIIEDGYVHIFVFIDGLLYSLLNPQKGYFIPKINVKPMPCITTETIVYLIETPDKIKGYAILEWPGQMTVKNYFTIKN